MSGTVRQIGIHGVCVLAVVTGIEFIAGVTVLGDAQPILFGLMLLAWLIPNARTGTRSQRTAARIGIAGVVLLLLDATGPLLS